MWLDGKLAQRAVTGLVKTTRFVREGQQGIDQNGTELRSWSMVSAAMRRFNHFMPMGCE